MNIIKSVLIGALVALLGASAGAADAIQGGEIRISHGQVKILTNAVVTAAIPWADVNTVADKTFSSDESVVKVIESAGYAAITNTVMDGEAAVTVTKKDGTVYKFTAKAMTVGIEKTVVPWSALPESDDRYNPDNRSNATIRITTHVLYGRNVVPTNNILFVGSYCNSHGLTHKTLVDSINKLAEKGNVDWSVYSNDGSSNIHSESGSLTMGDTLKEIAWFKDKTNLSGAHKTLKEFLERILKASKETKKYDYIALEFDGGRMLSSYKYVKDTADAVAQYLRPFYENNRVIWIVDDAEYSINEWKGKGIQSPEDNIAYSKDIYYTPTSTYCGSDGDANARHSLSYDAWQGYVALLQPSLYLDSAADERYVKMKPATDWTNKENNPIYFADKIAAQADYSHLEKIQEMIDQNVKVAVYDTELVDNVVSYDNALAIPESIEGKYSSVRIYQWPTNQPAPETFLTSEMKAQGKTIADLAGWKTADTSNWVVAGHTITGNVHNITREWWNMVEIDVVDTGDFLAKCIENGNYDKDYFEETGKYRVDPNDGPAEVTLISIKNDGGSIIRETVTANAQATMVGWEIPDKRFLVDSTDACRVYDGIATNILVAVTNAGLNEADYVISNRTVGTEQWYDYRDWQNLKKYVNVADSTNVEFKVEGKGYVTYVGTNTVTITPRSLTNEFAIVAIDTNMVYGTTPYPTPTWKGGENLVKGDGLKVTLDYTNEVWDVGRYPDAIVTNALIAVTNSANEDVTKNYAIEFKPATLEVTPKPILPKNPKTEPPTNPDPKDPTAGNPEPENPPVPTLWAPNVVKYYDGIGTNTKAKVYGVEGYDFTYEYTTNDNIEVEEVWADSLLLTNVLRDVDNKVTSYKVYCRAKDEAGNYVGTNCFAWVTILPRPLTNEFAVVACDTNMVYGAESAPTPTWKGGTDVAEGDKLYVNLCYTNEGASASWPVGTYPDAIVTNLTDGIVVTNKFGEDVTSNYVIEFKPGELKVTKAAMGFVALDVVKEYDGIATNIVMGTVTNKETGATISSYSVSNSYDNAKWYLGSEFPGYTDVTNAAVVHIKVFADGYSPATGSATVTILPRPLTNEFAVVAIDTNMVYGTTPRPTPTWKGGENLVKGDGLKVTLDYTNEVWNVGTYPDAIVTNALIAVTNSANEDVTANYAIEFKPATLTVNPAKITPKEPSEPDPADPKENPSEEPPETPKDPDGDPILWAQDIVKVYDGLGTNILPNVYYAVDGNNFTYEFATNLAGEASWFADKDHIACTNVVRNGDGTVGHYKVYYRAKNTEGNYLGVTNFAYVTILPAPITIGPGEDGPVTQPSYGEDPIPPADPDDENSWTNGALSVIKEYDGQPTNIVVKVTDPTDVDFVIEYSYDGKTWYPEDGFAGYVLPTNTAPVWYAVSDPNGNYIPVTNRAFVTIWKRAEEKKGDVPMDKGDLEQLNEDLKKVIGEDSGEHPFLKVQLTVDETNSLDNANTWIGPADAKAQAEAIVAASPVPVVDSHFYDIVLERTYEFAVAQNVQGVARNYNNSNRWENAGWDDIGDGTDQLLTIALRPFTAQQMEGKSLIGAYRHHGGSVELINEKSKVPAGSECYEIDTQDPLKIILHVKKFSIYGFLLKSNAAMLKATLDWAYNNGTGQYVAQLKVACTNGIENLDASDVKFAFEDRVDEENKPYATLKQWVANCRYTEDAVEETINGTKFRVCVIDAGAAQIKAAGLNQEITVGPASTAGSVVQMADRKAGYPCLFVADRLKPVAGNETSAKSTVKSFLGYVLWKANGTQWALPVTAGAAPVAAVDWPTQPLTQLLSVPRMNLCLSMGVSPSASGDFSCAVKEFAVTDGRISGRVGTSDGRRESVPSAASTVVLRGAKTLGGEFERLCELDCDEEGRFETDAPEGYPYFKVSIEPGSIVK